MTTSCTAGGAWSGAKAASGSQTVTPAAVGAQNYSLSCTDATGTTSASTTLSVTAAPAKGASGGGGGACSPAQLGALALLALFRRRRSPVQG